MCDYFCLQSNTLMSFRTWLFSMIAGQRSDEPSGPVPPSTWAREFFLGMQRLCRIGLLHINTGNWHDNDRHDDIFLNKEWGGKKMQLILCRSTVTVMYHCWGACSEQSQHKCFCMSTEGGHDTKPNILLLDKQVFIAVVLQTSTHTHTHTCAQTLSEWPPNSQQFKTTRLIKILSDAIKFRKK